MVKKAEGYQLREDSEYADDGGFESAAGSGGQGAAAAGPPTNAKEPIPISTRINLRMVVLLSETVSALPCLTDPKRRPVERTRPG